MAPLIAPRRPFETPARHLCLKGRQMNDNQIDPWDLRIRKAKYRGSHRGTKESDLVVGGFFDRYHASWTEADLACDPVPQNVSGLNERNLAKSKLL
jgi:hypothetical protein